MGKTIRKKGYSNEWEEHNRRYDELKASWGREDKKVILQLFRDFLDDYPNDALASAEYHRFILINDEFSSEHEYSVQVLDSIKNQPKISASAYSALFSYYMTRDFEKSMELLREIKRKKIISEPSSTLMEIEAYCKNQRRDDVLPTLRRFKPTNIKEKATYVFLTISYEHRSRLYKRAEELLADLDYLKSKEVLGEVKYKNSKIKLLYIKGKYKMVIEEYEKSLKPIVYTRTLIFIYTSYVKLGKTEEAAKILELLKNTDEFKASLADKIYVQLLSNQLSEVEGNIEAIMNDRSATSTLIKYYLENSQYEKAIDLCEKLLINGRYDINVANNLITSYIALKRYEEAKRVLDTYSSDIKMESYNKYLITETFLSKKLGYTFENTRVNEIYTCRQIINYSEDALKEHIRKHQEAHGTRLNYYIFKEEIDLDEIIKRVKEEISRTKPLIKGVTDIYNINMPGVCYDVDVINVVTLSNSTDIITMYPDGLKENELEEEEQIPLKVESKRMSQIDKFNMRLAKKK